MFSHDDDLYKYGVEMGSENDDSNYELDINKQFDKTDIELLAAELNDSLTEKLALDLDAENFEVLIEGFNNYLEITVINKKTSWLVLVQLSYYKLCFYANRLSITRLSEKIMDFIFEADEKGIIEEDAQVLFELHI